MADKILKVRVFKGKTIEEVAGKADNLSLLSGKVEAFHIIKEKKGYKIVVAFDHWE